ncbi:D-alanyl-D-alanine carboxypeptidase DacF [Clostridia bacterium]|nr:D-alanyl-D-alanine carboxypeptidase DacF [Clostridia bacterium]
MKRALCLIAALMMVNTAALAAELPDVATDTSVTGVMAEGLGQPLITAQSALVAELNSDVTLYDKNSREARPMASLTKIMTILLCLESGLDLQTEVTASESALDFDNSEGSNADIKVGEVMTFENLLYCIMVKSANEACNVAAEAVAGTVDAFVRRMNDRARELKCLNTNFINTHGLHEEGHYSTAYDMFLITREALKYLFFMQLANTTSKAIPPTNMTNKERSLLTTNYLISKTSQDGYTYHLAQGIKTGHHSKAGYCLVSAAESDGLYIVTVVMGAVKSDDGVMHSFTDTKALMEWSFKTYEFRQILKTTELITAVRVGMGEDRDTVNAVPKTSASALVPKILDTKNITRNFTITDEGDIVAPVAKGQQLGELTLTYRNYTFATVPLISDTSVKRSEQEHLIDEANKFISQPIVKYIVIGVAGLIALYVLVMIIVGIGRRKNRERGNYRGRKKRRK